MLKHVILHMNLAKSRFTGAKNVGGGAVNTPRLGPRSIAPPGEGGPLSRCELGEGGSGKPA